LGSTLGGQRFTLLQGNLKPGHVNRKFVEEVGAEQNELSEVAACICEDVIAIEDDRLGW
jgi:hypothetical protein